MLQALFAHDSSGRNSAFARFDRAVQIVTAILIIVLVFAMTTSILAGVFSRYVLNAALIWSEELARYAMVWLTFLGGGLAFRRGSHIAVEFLVERLPSRGRRVVVALGQAAVLFFLVVLAWKGAQMVGNSSFQTSAAMRISMSWIYLALPVGAVLMIYHMLVMMFDPVQQAGPRENIVV